MSKFRDRFSKNKEAEIRARIDSANHGLSLQIAEPVGLISATRHLVSLLVDIAKIYSASEAYQTNIMSIHGRLAEPLDVSSYDYTQIVESIRAIQLPKVVSGTTEAPSEKRNPTLDLFLKKLSRVFEISSKFDEKTDSTFIRWTEDIIQTAIWIKESRQTLLNVISQLIERISVLSDNDPQTQRRLQERLERLKQVGEISELETLREALISEANMLLDGARSQSQQLNAVNEVVAQAKKKVSELHGALQDARAKALTDELTNLGNRRAMNMAVDNYASTTESTGVIVLDVDYFKQINDQHGHAAGDEVLKLVSACLVSCLRENDRAFRVGGEEFAVLISGANYETVTAVSERIRAKLSDNPFQVGAGQVSATASLGATIWVGGERFPEALERADSALYEAKRSGRNKSVVKKQKLVKRLLHT